MELLAGSTSKKTVPADAFSACLKIFKNMLSRSIIFAFSFGKQRSPVTQHVRDVGAAGSNPVIPANAMIEKQFSLLLPGKSFSAL